MYRDRFLTVYHQLVQDQRFANSNESDGCLHLPPISLAGEPVIRQKTLKQLSLFNLEENDRIVLTPVESLPGNPGLKFSYGFLSRLEEERLSLEGLTLSVPVDLSKARMAQDFICEGSLVLVKGVMDDTVLRVTELAMPPAPARKDCDLSKNYFAGDIDVNFNDADEDCTAVIISDFHLDNAKVLQGFEDMLTGFLQADCFPELYVLMGSFSSEAPGVAGDRVKAYQESFQAFSDMLRKHEKVVSKARIVMIPGPNDPGPTCLPRFPVDNHRTHGISKDHPNLILASNPCRVRLGNRELVFMRAGLSDELRRHRLVSSKEAYDITKMNGMTAKAVFSQMHLFPVNTAETAIMWDFDNALRLYPIPHAVFVGQGSESANTLVNGSHFATVGSFYPDFTFFCFQATGGIEGDIEELALSEVYPREDDLA